MRNPATANDATKSANRGRRDTTRRNKENEMKRRRTLFLLMITTALGFSQAVQAQCTGDCDGNGSVSVSELIRGVNINLGICLLYTSDAADEN